MIFLPNRDFFQQNLKRYVRESYGMKTTCQIIYMHFAHDKYLFFHGQNTSCVIFFKTIFESFSSLSDHFVFLGYLSLIFVVLIICLFIYKTCKIKCSKEPTKRLVFLKRMSLIHILASGLLILFAVMLIMSGGLETV